MNESPSPQAIPGEIKPLTLADIKGPARGYDGPISFACLSPQDRITAAERYGYVEHLITPGDRRMLDLVKEKTAYYLDHGVCFETRKRPQDGSLEFIVRQPGRDDLADAGYSLYLIANHPLQKTGGHKTGEDYLREVSNLKAGINPQQTKQEADTNMEYIQTEWEKTIRDNPGKTRIIWGLEEDSLFVKN